MHVSYVCTSCTCMFMQETKCIYIYTVHTCTYTHAYVGKSVKLHRKCTPIILPNLHCRKHKEMFSFFVGEAPSSHSVPYKHSAIAKCSLV